MKIKLFLISVVCFCAQLLIAQENKELKFNDKKEFKIVQFTDIHYVTDSLNSEVSINLMKKAIEQEKPDLIVFTGDVITCRPQKNGWDNVLQIPIDYKIPFAVILGNHDDEYDWTRRQIMDYVQTKPYSLGKNGPENIKGASNYTLTILGSKDNSVKSVLYFLDSNAYNKAGDRKGYDWFAFNQVEWYRQQSELFTKANNGVPYPSLAFFHIPLQEYSLLSDSTKFQSIGTRGENECPGILNSGMFTAFYDCKDVMGTFVGHDHNNDYIGCIAGICLAYGRFTGSKNTYTDIGNGYRIIILKEGERTFDTWIRTGEGDKLHSISYPDSLTKN